MVQEVSYEVVGSGRMEGKYSLHLQMPINSEKTDSSSNDCLVSRRHVQEKKNNSFPYYIAAENSILGKNYELFQLNLSACLTVGLVLQPPCLMLYFSLDKMHGDLQRTSERPIIVSISLDDGWLHAARWQFSGHDGFWLISTFIPLPHLRHTWYFRLFCVVL
jgi:hypothetical protein